MTLTQKLAKFNYIINIFYVVYFFCFTILAFIFFFYAWTYTYQHVDAPGMSPPSPTIKNKLFSILYMLVLITYWILTFNLGKIRSLEFSPKSIKIYWFLTLINYLIIIILMSEIAGFPNLPLKSKEESLVFLIVFIPIIPLFISCIGFVVSILSYRSKKHQQIT